VAINERRRSSILTEDERLHVDIYVGLDLTTEENRMKLDATTQMLFSPFEDREVANPSRRHVRNIDDFIRFIEQNNGVADCFSSVYPADGTIDKIFFDIDSKGVAGSVEDARKLYSHLLMKDLNVIPIISGKKGFHFYVLLKPKRYKEAKTLLTKAAYSILYEVFGSDNGKINVGTVDPHIIGDIRRISRVPNTLRPPENLTWCTYLPEDWVKMSTAELVEQMKSPHTYDYILDGETPTLHDFPEPPIEITEWNPVESTTAIHPMKGNIFLKNLLRPCLYRHMMMNEPRHDVRVASTIDLLGFFTPQEIFEIYEVLGWKDWDPKLTWSQIESCKGFKPYGCKRLRNLGIPEVCCIA